MAKDTRGLTVQDLVHVFLILCMFYIGYALYVLILTHTLRRNVLGIQNTELVDATQPAAMFKDYLRDFNKTYDNKELMKRFLIFKDALKEIYRLNQETGAIHGLTKFSDMTKEEVFPTVPLDPHTLVGSENKCRPIGKPCPSFHLDAYDLCNLQHLSEYVPSKFDWRAQGKIGPVLDQKACNGCWAFTITEIMESMEAIWLKESVDTRLSVQEVLDCTNNTDGCAGGNVMSALYSMCKHNLPVVTEDEYPLFLISRNCTLPHDSVGIRVKHYCQHCDINSNDILRLLYQHGPVIAVVNADPWLQYTGGVIQRACISTYNDDTAFKHVVQIVGYDTSAEVPHYIVRNTWGSDFGVDGYVLLAISDNVCGVRDAISFLDVFY